MKLELYGKPRVVNLANGDFIAEPRYKDNAFGIYLAEGGTIKATTEDGVTDTFVLGVGYHPLMFTKIYATGTNVTSLIIFY